MSAQYYLAISVDVLLALALPIALAIVAARKLTKLRVVLAGAAVFTLFQLVLRLPLLSVLQYVFPQLVPKAGFTAHYVLYSAVLALTAGIFEEFGRYLGLLTVLRKYRSWGDGFGYGVGHGGIEAIALLGINSLAGLFMNIAAPGTSMEQMVMGGVERLFALTLQIGLSLVVMLAMRRGRFSLVLLAVGLHTLVDFPMGLITLSAGPWATEALIGLFALASLVWIVRSRRLFRDEDRRIPEVAA